MKKNRLLILLLLAMPFAVAAQGDVDLLFKGTLNDAKYLAEGYMSPMMKSIGYGLNQGWYNTAKTHKFPGFDLTFSVNPVFAPSSDKVFLVDNSKLNNMSLETDLAGNHPSATTGTGNMATVFGDKKQVAFGTKPLPTGTSPGPGGIGIAFFPTPTLNLGIGLPKGFDLKVRFVPTIDFGKLSKDKVVGSFGLWGVGVMHDFKQWIPGIKQLPFDMSVLVAYTKMTFTIGLDKANPDRKLDLQSTATTVQVLISKKLSVLTGYAGFGYNMATTKLALKGTYSFTDQVSKKDPFDMSADSSGARATFGLRLKFGPIAFHGDYTFAKYNAASAGIGIAVR